ncbi:acetyltransferase [Mycobacterium sp. 1554424.7]|nr:acetyltransferase [Mycobacterium sp. 1554424.7]
MKDIEGLLHSYDMQMRGLPSDLAHMARCERDGSLLRVVGQVRGLICAPADIGLRGIELDRLIGRQREYFAARGEAVEWKTHGHDKPDDLTDRLRAAGFIPEKQEMVMIGLADQMTVAPPLPDGLVVRQVTASGDMQRISALQSAVWQQDWGWLADDLTARVANAPDETAVFIAEADSEIVSAGWLGLHPGTEFASLWGGSTLPHWRGRGIYRALVATRARIAVARGVRLLQVDASADSAPILRRLGFDAVTTTTPYVWSPRCEE